MPQSYGKFFIITITRRNVAIGYNISNVYAATHVITLEQVASSAVG
jgi:hypothetical protein